MVRIPPQAIRFLSAVVLGTAALVAQTTATRPTTAVLPEEAPKTLARIDRDDLLGHARHLASDALQGRLTATPGQALAAEYIAKKFAELGLEPYGDREGGTRSWLQKYPVRRTTLDPRQTAITVAGRKLEGGFSVIRGQSTKPLTAAGELVFLGLGRPGEDVTEATQLEGRIAFVLLRGGAKKVPGPEMQFMTAMQPLNRAGKVAESLEAKGAKLVVFGLLTGDHDALLNTLSYVAISPDRPIVEPRAELTRLVGEGSLSGLGRSIAGRQHRVVASPELTIALLKAGGVQLADAEKLLAEPGTPLPASKPVPAKFALAITQDDKAFATNVVALRRGRDPQLAKQAVVFSAHMDHVGTRMDGHVFNGADDDASGTSGLLEIAQAFATGSAPRRSLLFLSVSGEELGLWGSDWFAAHPTFDGELVADVNIDMIGRSGKDEGYAKDSTTNAAVMITPSHAHEMFSTIVQDAARLAKAMQLELKSGDVYYHRSDHYNFAKKGIPVVFFCTGEHADYHQVTDDADKLDGAKMETVTRLAAWTGWLVAEAKEKPRTLGSMEDWASDGPGQPKR